ncbi:hypothetical protein POG22_02245 [Geitlerinema sp. CS-897]|uniref:hypothetical protein n=1 Tax=Baaleninema simplex TaxID=2862350 RepID=UPI000346AB2C|nr:hypothetical protein [Baaleninema simplex]MDC0831832.1 hypothetical protein [Geitlerinema sp. CS-897]
MSELNCETCPVCKVKIQKLPMGDRVLFSFGAPGTREMLWKRVCQHTQDRRCINRELNAK